MDVGLVIFEEEVFFFGEGVGFEGDFEFVGGFGWFLDGLVLGFVDGGEKREFVSLASLGSVNV